jgi:putative nucleotidyltransferase with HDIG domain
MAKEEPRAAASLCTKIVEHGRAQRFLSLLAQLYGVEILLCDGNGKAVCHFAPEDPPTEGARRPLPVPLDIEAEDGRLFRIYLNGWNHPLDEPTLSRLSSLLKERLLCEVENEREKDSLADEIIGAYQELNLWYNLGDSVSQVTDPDAICEYITGQVLSLLHCTSAGIFLLNEDKSLLRLHTCSGRLPSPHELAGVPTADSTFRIVVIEGQTLAIAGPEELQGVEKELGLGWAFPLLGVPMRARGETIGVLVAAGEERGPNKKPSSTLFSSSKRRLLFALGSQAAVLLQNARLYNELRELFYSAVQALADAVDAKDPYTHGHSRRVALYAVAIGKQLDLSPAELADLELASLLHDVGKIGTSEAVLNKPGKLSPREYEHMKQHVVEGAEIVGHVEAMRKLVPIILHHHERYDGHGYPRGLAGEEIPLGARILAVADAFDAMTSSRPYRPAMSIEQAVEEIKANRGTQFDPSVVDAFLRYLACADFPHSLAAQEESLPTFRIVRRFLPYQGKYLTGIELVEPWTGQE